MKLHGLGLRIVVVLLLLVIPASAQVQTICPGGTITTSFDLPPKGMARFQTITIDDDCNLIRESVRTVQISEMPFDIQNLNTPRVVETLNSGEANGIRGAWTFYTVNQLYDLATILMNEVRSTVSTVWDANNNVTSYTYDAYYNWNTEQGTCGPGWNLVSTNNLIQSGGVGYNYTKSKQTGKFGYQGFFDCPGGYYNNNLKNMSTVSIAPYGWASAECKFVVKYENSFPGWYVNQTCYS